MSAISSTDPLPSGEQPASASHTRRVPRVVALGGGHGLHATLSALRILGDRGVVDPAITAVVTVADDGGSSGRLRRELGLLPPGDLRMAMAALAANDSARQRWQQVIQHRFGGSGALAGHAVGNLLLAGLMEVLGDPVAALDEVGALLGIRGRVLPMSCDPLDIEADVTGLDLDDPTSVHRIRGQVAVASTPGRVLRVWLRPEHPRACPQAVAAIDDADVLVLGPGSWFTSVLPHLLVPGLREALLRSQARRVIVLNLAPEPGETAGFSPEKYLAVLAEHAPDLRVDAVLADIASVPVPRRLRHAARTMLTPGGCVHLAPVAAATSHEAGSTKPRHDPAALASALTSVFDKVLPVGAANVAERRS